MIDFGRRPAMRRIVTNILALALVVGAPAVVFADDQPNPASGTSFPYTLLIVYCAMIAMASLAGGVLPTLIHLTHTRMQMLVSLVGGLMLGVGIFHQLPHAVSIMPSNGGASLDRCMLWLMIGMVMTFFMLRMFHFHSHDVPTEALDSGHDHDHDCAHDHDHGHHHHDHDHGHDHGMPVKSSWIGILFGLSVHTLLDGVALAAAVQADAIHQHGTGSSILGSLLGVGTFLGVVLHKPLDSLSITSLMATGGWSRQWMRLVNIGYATMCPIGVALFCVGIQSYSGTRDNIVAAALAMSAGVFICISLSDLLPELQFHSHDRFWLSAALLSGITAAWLIGFIEPEHAHTHPPSAGQEHNHPHDHQGHHHH